MKLQAFFLLGCSFWTILFIKDSDGLKKSARARASAICGDSSWALYKDEKCIKLVQELMTHKDAQTICFGSQEHFGDLGNSNSLISIRSQEEQEEISKYVFEEHSLFENVWLGARRINETEDFQWDDGENGASLEFENWAPENPTNEPEKNCAQLTSHLSRKSDNVQLDSAGDGLWRNVACEKRNYVLCQKNPNWGISELQNAVLQLRKQMKELQENPVPVGFIFTQLPGEPDPSKVWPNPTLIWTEITGEYAGLFFRAQGGDSAPFGETQLDNSPRFTQMRHDDYAAGDPNDKIKNPMNVTYSDGWTEEIRVGHFNPGDSSDEGLKFWATGGEVRPKNTAVRIWKRTA